eukprot:scaffold374803_cov39-Prasinocladus_malaysianus.AAC.1
MDLPGLLQEKGHLASIVKVLEDEDVASSRDSSIRAEAQRLADNLVRGCGVAVLEEEKGVLKALLLSRAAMSLQEVLHLAGHVSTNE